MGALIQNPLIQARLLRLRVVLVGLAMDFWKDTPFDWSFGLSSKKAANAQPAERTPTVIEGGAAKPAKKEKEPKLWSGDRIQVMEKFWGQGHALPGGDDYIDMLAKPLGITKEMNILDLGAGLGGLGRRIATEFGAYVTGMETDPALVSRGMILSIAAGKSKQASVEAYNPETFSSKRKYDCVFARELFYRIADKDKFFQAVAESVKPKGGQIVFTDFLLIPGAESHPAIVEWRAKEGGVTPLSSVEMIKKWKALKFDLRVAEDQTDEYRREILKGMANALESLSAATPDAATKMLLLQEIYLWAERLNAFKHGLRYYRFYGIKY